MKKLIAVILALTLAANLASCSKAESKTEPAELVVFAAASLTETLTEIIELYKQVAPNISIIATFDSSGTLKTQIEQGADCDIFISAAQKQMNQLDIEMDEDKNPDRLDFVLHETRLNLLVNQVVLVVPEGNPKNIGSFDDMAQALRDGNALMCMGNSDVPVGQYTSEILAYFGLDENSLADKGLITYGTNVKEVTTQVAEGAVDFGVVYCTDAYSANLTVADSAGEDMCSQVIYPAAVMKSSKNVDAAKAFLEYLQSDEGASVFKKVGFEMAG
ncbi:MAG: molybdate ABC transporter substrate-binding protein [Oscillospiraceae bacterium]|jgi:molybdate transport system substrate-binding protein